MRTTRALMCRAVELSLSGHHAHSTWEPRRRAIDEQLLDVLVAAIFAELHGRYGTSRNPAGDAQARVVRRRKSGSPRRCAGGTTSRAQEALKPTIQPRGPIAPNRCSATSPLS